MRGDQQQGAQTNGACEHDQRGRGAFEGFRVAGAIGMKGNTVGHVG